MKVRTGDPIYYVVEFTKAAQSGVISLAVTILNIGEDKTDGNPK